MVRSLSNYTPAHAPKVEEVPTESAWERGLRHAKEVRYLQSMAMYHMCNTYKMNSWFLAELLKPNKKKNNFFLFD